MNRTELGCTIAVGAGLFALYAWFVVAFLTKVDFSLVDGVQVIVFTSMIGRLLAVMIVFGLTRKVPNALLALFAADVVVTIALLGAHLLVPVSSLVILAQTIYSSTATALLVGLPGCLIFFTLFEMARGPRLTRILLSVVLEVGMLSFLSGHLSQAQGLVGFGGFVQWAILAAQGDIVAGSVPQLSGPFSVFPSAAIYCALLVYSRVSPSGRGTPARVVFALPILGALFALGWLSFTAVYLRSLPPTLIIRTAIGAAPLLACLVAIWALKARATFLRPRVVTRADPFPTRPDG